MDRVLRATAVVVPWLRRNDCQQAMLSLTGVMAVNVPFALAAAAQQRRAVVMGTCSCASLRAVRVGCETTGPTVPSVPVPVN